MSILENQTTEVSPELNHIVEYLRNNTWSSFYKSLLEQYELKGKLSEKQIACVQTAIDKQNTKKAEPKITPDTQKKEFSLKPDDIIEIKQWLAKNMKTKFNMDFFLRNLEVVEVLNETVKAYQLKVRFVSKIVVNCHVCGRALDNEVSKATGIGPVCATKLGLARPTINEAHLTLSALEGLCTKVGIIEIGWVPKSQIKSINGVTQGRPVIEEERFNDDDYPEEPMADYF